MTYIMSSNIYKYLCCGCTGDDDAEDDDVDEKNVCFIADGSSPRAILRTSSLMAAGDKSVPPRSPTANAPLAPGQHRSTRCIDVNRNDAKFDSFSRVGHFNSATKYLM